MLLDDSNPWVRWLALQALASTAIEEKGLKYYLVPIRR